MNIAHKKKKRKGIPVAIPEIHGVTPRVGFCIPVSLCYNFYAMKKDIHPKYYPNARVLCACGNSFNIGATKEFIEVEICSKCHPFYTGHEKAFDTVGQVQKFKKRLEKKSEIKSRKK